ncbi:MAG: hypothetical protein AAF497_19860, partial [Planctomycetota bacterium]
FDPATVTRRGDQLNFGTLPEGNFSFTMTVTDNGWGNKSADKRIRIVVVAPEPEEVITLRPEAMDSKISGKFWIGDEPKIDIDIRPRGEKLELGVGDSFDLDEKTWTVTKIDGKFVTIDVDGESLVFRLGAMLANPEQQKAVTSATTSTGR